jgi:hypothetical protein
MPKRMAFTWYAITRGAAAPDELPEPPLTGRPLLNAVLTIGVVCMTSLRQQRPDGISVWRTVLWWWTSARQASRRTEAISAPPADVIEQVPGQLVRGRRTQTVAALFVTAIMVTGIFLLVRNLGSAGQPANSVSPATTPTPAATSDAGQFRPPVELIQINNEWQPDCTYVTVDLANENNSLRLYCRIGKAGTGHGGVDRWLKQFRSDIEARADTPETGTSYTVYSTGKWTGPGGQRGEYVRYHHRGLDCPAIWLKDDRYPIVLILFGDRGGDAFGPLEKVLDRFNYSLH